MQEVFPGGCFRAVSDMPIEDLTQEVWILAYVFHSTDVLWGETRAISELCSRFDALVSEILSRVEAEDWRARRR